MPGMKLSKRFHQRKRELKNNMNNSHYYWYHEFNDDDLISLWIK
jgi:hypothetical protein